MWLETAVVVSAGAVVGACNAVTTRRLWASPMFETSQKIAQTVFIWILPGAFLVSRHLLREPAVRTTIDPATGDTLLEWDNPWHVGDHRHGDGGSHGWDGGDHASHDVGTDGGGAGGDGGGGGSDGGGGSGGADGGT